MVSRNKIELADYLNEYPLTFKNTYYKAFRARIVIVQPSISKNQDMPSKIQDVLAASEYYIKRGGKVNDFEIWGSE